MSHFTGIIIEESLIQKKILKDLRIIGTKVESITSKHQTPWVRQWTLHTVEIPAEQADKIAQTIRKSLDKDYEWYADFKNETIHYIIFRTKIFKIDRTNKAEYDEATKYGISIGIPKHQVDFSPHVKAWNR